ncbi:MAG: LytTR family transcriptional regulator [Lachnospiraceae bacterium]|nr:LytTR family transcriptional regulator [Lachnospiraceae bacterium]
MKILIEDPSDGEEDTIIIRCRQLDDRLLQFIYEAKMRKEKLTGLLGGTIHLIDPTSVFYFEAVDNRVFIYCKEQVYESRLKLYEIEAMFRDTSFFRASKSCILNLDKISNITSAFNGRLETTLKNNEKVIISRQYVPALKEKLGI